MTTCIASFDIGKKNFAFYVEEVDTLELEKLTTIPKNRRYRSDGTPTDEFEKLISTIYLTGNTVLYRNLDLTEGAKKGKYLDSVIYHNMISALDNYKDVFDRCSIIVIEQQMSFKQAQNTMALKLGQHCYSYFIFRYPITQDGDFVFDELGLFGYVPGANGLGAGLPLLTHVIFSPVQKALNRLIQIEYTVRVQTLTNLTA